MKFIIYNIVRCQIKKLTKVNNLWSCSTLVRPRSIIMKRKGWIPNTYSLCSWVEGAMLGWVVKLPQVPTYTYFIPIYHSSFIFKINYFILFQFKNDNPIKLPIYHCSSNWLVQNDVGFFLMLFNWAFLNKIFNQFFFPY
jgi:hypothetical protein